MQLKNYILKNKHNTEVHVINYGGIITRIFTRDRKGIFGNITLGYDDDQEYITNIEHPYFGALVGRYANRIAKGKFTLDGHDYKLAINNGPNALHGGRKGFDKVFWDCHQEGNVLSLSYLSSDGEEGYPGNLKVNVTYELTDSNELKIHYCAETDKATPINLTQHTYFNLSAVPNTSILHHELQINANAITEVDRELTPTGKTIPVEGTKFDFTHSHEIARPGFDHNYILRGDPGELKLAATLYEKESGRFMEVWTTEPGLQFYSGNFLDGKLYGKNTGLCLETQHFPDSPNHSNFPSTILRPGNKYTSTTIYEFAVK